MSRKSKSEYIVEKRRAYAITPGPLGAVCLGIHTALRAYVLVRRHS